MYRLLIVDNEHIVVDSLMFFFEAQGLDNLEATGAYSAREALEIMESSRVDILLTDIRMPVIDGLQLQKEVSVRWPWCRTIFLSGFNEFEYVQEAMRGRAVDYLLKTEGNEAILRAVQRTMEALDNQLRADELIRRAQAQYESSLALINHKLLLSLANGYAPVPENLAERFQQQRIRLSPERVWAACLRFDERPRTESLDDLTVAIEAIAREYLGAGVPMAQLQASTDELIWLLSFGQPWAERRAQVYLKGALETIQRQCAEKLGAAFSLALAEEAVAWPQLPAKVERLRYLINRSLRCDPEGRPVSGLLLTDSAPSEVEAWLSGELRVQLDKLTLMETYLEASNRYAFMETLSDVLAALDGAPERIGPDVRMEVFYSLSAILLRQMNRLNLREAVSRDFNLGALQPRDSWRDITDGLKRFSEAIFKAKLSAASDAEDDLARRVRWAVENNLGGDLSLTRLGDMEGVSASYLAKVYKGVTGESLKGYIARMRFERAKDLLRDPSLRNRHVGQAVGYPAEQSFNRFFKMMCGLTPKEYRRQLGLEK